MYTRYTSNHWKPYTKGLRCILCCEYVCGFISQDEPTTGMDPVTRRYLTVPLRFSLSHASHCCRFQLFCWLLRHATVRRQRETWVQVGDARPKGCEISIAPRNARGTVTFPLLVRGTGALLFTRAPTHTHTHLD